MNAGIELGVLGGSEPASRLSALAMDGGSVARASVLGDLAEAIKAFAYTTFDLLLVEGSGATQSDYAELRRLAPHTPWLVVDDSDDPARIRRWIEQGASAVLRSTDLDPAGLASQLHQALARRSLDSARESRCDDFRAIFEHGPLPMWVYEVASLRFLAVNDAAVRAYGYPRAAFLAMTLRDIRPDEDRERFDSVFQADLPAQQQAEIWRHQTADGRVFPVEIVAEALRYAGSGARLVVARDVSAEHQAIAALEASGRRYSDLFEHSLGLLCTHDLDGVLRSANPAAASAVGYRVDELLGRSMKDIVPADLHGHFDDYLRRIGRAGEDSGMLGVLHRDGSQRVWSYQNRVFREESGEAIVMGHAQDITQRRLYEQRLLEQQAALEAVNDGSPLGLVRADLAGEFTYVNRSFERMSGLRADEALGLGWMRALHPDDRERVVREWTTQIAASERFKSTHRFRHGSDHTVWVSVEAAPLIVDAEITGYVASIEDVTARHQAEQQLRRNEQRLRTIADAMPALISYVDASLRFQFVNSAYEQVYARGRTQLIGLHAREVLGEETYTKRSPYIQRALAGERVVFEDEEESGESYRCMELIYIPQWDEAHKEVLGVHVMARDITRNKLDERRWVQAAEIDSMTGLMNRAAFVLRLDRALSRSHDQRSMLAVMYLDIDHFKQINDTQGHGVGDATLKAFAQRLSSVLRSSDVIGRLGGDEFAVITEGVRRPQYAAVAAAKIVAAMRHPFVLEREGVSLSVTASVGLALSKDEMAMTAASMLERADRALYEAKAAGRNGYRVAAEGYPDDEGE